MIDEVGAYFAGRTTGYMLKEGKLIGENVILPLAVGVMVAIFLLPFAPVLIYLMAVFPQADFMGKDFRYALIELEKRDKVTSLFIVGIIILVLSLFVTSAVNDSYPFLIAAGGIFAFNIAYIMKLFGEYQFYFKKIKNMQKATGQALSETLPDYSFALNNYYYSRDNEEFEKDKEIGDTKAKRVLKRHLDDKETEIAFKAIEENIREGKSIIDRMKHGLSEKRFKKQFDAIVQKITKEENKAIEEEAANNVKSGNLKAPDILKILE